MASVNEAEKEYAKYDISPNSNGSYTVDGKTLTASEFASAKKKAKSELDRAKKQSKKNVAATKEKQKVVTAKEQAMGQAEARGASRRATTLKRIALLEARNQVDALRINGQDIPKELQVVAGGISTETPETMQARIASRNAEIATLKPLVGEEPTTTTTVTSPTTAMPATTVAPTAGKPGPDQMGPYVGQETTSSYVAPSTAATPVGAGGTKGGAGGGKPSAGKKLAWDKVAAQFKSMFPSQSWMLDIDPAKYPDVQTLIRKAQSQNMTPERFAEEWKNTSFYKEAASTGVVRQITQLVGDVGFDSVPLNAFVTKALNMGWSGDTLKFEAYKEAFRQDTNGAFVNPTAVERVKKSNDYLQVANIGKAFFNQVSDSAVQQVLTGQMSGDDVVRQQRELAKTRYGHLSGLIDQGLSLQDIADNYKTQAAQLLEVDPNSIDMSSANYEVALNYGEPDKKRLMTQGEWQKLLRSDPKYGWEKTNNAKQEAQKLSDSIVAAFGRVL